MFFETQPGRFQYRNESVDDSYPPFLLVKSNQPGNLVHYGARGMVNPCVREGINPAKASSHETSSLILHSAGFGPELATSCI